MDKMRDKGIGYILLVAFIFTGAWKLIGFEFAVIFGLVLIYLEAEK